MTAMQACIRVVVVDDHPMVREGLQAFLKLAADIEIVGEAATGAAAVALASALQPDVIVMDLVMPGEMDGIAAMAIIHRDYPRTHILALTSFQDSERAAAALKAGATGFLYKDVSPDLLLGAIRQAAAGQTVVEGRVWDAWQERQVATNGAQSVADSAAVESLHIDDTRSAVQRQLLDALTAREMDVLTCLASGMANKEIGAKLGITEKTVKVHVSHILAKLGVYDRTQAVILASKLGLVTL